ncbi:MAG: MFS transporter, partial [Nocardiopsaceae bacterium]|nr:MFS transporter [Nocardiopsaceae bacterium]
MSREAQARAPLQAADRAGRSGSGRSPRAVLIVMCAGYFLVLLDVTIVNVALPQIRAGLATSVTGLQWVVDGYALPLAALMLAGGTVGDLRGHKRIVQAGFALFGAASLGCGLAPGVAVLVAARVVQGAGAALLLPGTLAIISHAFPRGPAQARAIGIWAGIGSLALPAGPLLGGGLIAAFGWRAIFLINVPIVIAVVAAAQLVVGESTGPRGRRLDLTGVLLGGLFLLAMVFAVIQGGRAGAASPAVIGAALIAAAALAAFVLTEWRRGEQAVLPLPLLRRPAFTVANGAAGIMNLGSLGALFVLTLYLQSVHGYQPLTAGLALVPLFAPLAVLAPPTGRLISRIGPKLPAAAGFVLAGAGLALLTGAGGRSSYLVLLPAFLLWGAGLGLVTPAVVAAAIEAVPPGRAGLASGISNTARQAGGAAGIALAGAIAGQPGPGFVPGFHVVAAAAA